METDLRPHHEIFARVAQKDDRCGHCDQEIERGFTAFMLVHAMHNYPDGHQEHCPHWICLPCMSRTIRRWDKEAMNQVVNAK